MHHLERISVRIEYIRGIVSNVVFQPRTRRNVIPGAGGHRRLVEFIDLIVVFRIEAPMNRRRISLPLLEPEERSTSLTVKIM
jgi:hypothetical protein